MTSNKKTFYSSFRLEDIVIEISDYVRFSDDKPCDVSSLKEDTLVLAKYPFEDNLYDL